jgi:hypothetical protein
VACENGTALGPVIMDEDPKQGKSKKAKVKTEYSAAFIDG